MLRSANRYRTLSATLAARAVGQARRATGVAAAGLIVARHQAAVANETSSAVSAMLSEQGQAVATEAALLPLGFTTSAASFAAMAEQARIDWQFDRLVASLVQDAGRAAQSVSVATRPGVAHVRHLTLPSCSRCAVLAGRTYRYSDGFQRHPGCDCVMIPVTGRSRDMTYDPAELVRDGKVTGLSKADRQALKDGADFNQIVNVRRTKTSLRQSGESLQRRGRLTPAGIYAKAGSRDEALSLFQEHGYIQ